MVFPVWWAYLLIKYQDWEKKKKKRPKQTCRMVRAKSCQMRKHQVCGSDQNNKDGSKNSKCRLFSLSWVEFRKYYSSCWCWSSGTPCQELHAQSSRSYCAAHVFLCPDWLIRRKRLVRHLRCHYGSVSVFTGGVCRPSECGVCWWMGKGRQSACETLPDWAGTTPRYNASFYPYYESSRGIICTNMQ